MAVHSKSGVSGRAATVAAIIALTTTASPAQQSTPQRLAHTISETGSRDQADSEDPLAQPLDSLDRRQASPFEHLLAVDQSRRSLPWTDSVVTANSQLEIAASQLSAQAAVPADSRINLVGYDAVPLYAEQSDGACGGCGASGCDGCFYDKLKKLASTWDKFSVDGHVRVRHETSWNRINRPARNRGRLRARLQMKYKANDEIEAGIRWTTGDRKLVLEPGDRTGSVLSYQDAGDVFDKFAFNLDRIFITYKPEWAPDAFLTGGKFKMPAKLNPIFSSPIGSLGFDEAVHPEGIAGGYTWKDSLGVDTLKFVAGETIVLELGNQDEASMFFAQIWAENQMNDCLKVEAGVTMYDWHNLNPDGNTTVTLTNAGNAATPAPGLAGTIGGQIGVVDPAGTGHVPPANAVYDGVARSTFDSEFLIINPMVVVTWDDGDYDSGLQPIQFVFESFQNTEAIDNDRDFGYSIGAVYGPAVTRSGRKQGDWKFWYTWNDVQQDSVFTPVAQDDFQQATNFRGHFIGLDYFPWDQVEARFWILSDEPIITTGLRQEQWRARMDITVYF